MTTIEKVRATARVAPTVVIFACVEAIFAVVLDYVVLKLFIVLSVSFYFLKKKSEDRGFCPPTA